MMLNIFRTEQSALYLEVSSAAVPSEQRAYPGDGNDEVVPTENVRL